VHVAEKRGKMIEKMPKNGFVKKIENYRQNARKLKNVLAII
jgi:hypothetical protein